MEKNKTGKPASRTGRYLKYAIGEIVLVVIGILIALQINNWNNNRQNKIEEQTILKNLMGDLVLELDGLDSHAKAQVIWINSCEYILKHFDANNGFKVDDGLLERLNDLFIRNSYLPNLTTFRTLENTGKIDLINNRTLKDQIVSYYYTMINFSENTTNNNTTLVDQLVNQSLINLTVFQMGSFSPEMEEHWILTADEPYKVKNSGILKNQLQKKLDDMDYALQTLNAVNFRMFLANIQLGFSKQRRDDTQNIIAAIENELQLN